MLLFEYWSRANLIEFNMCDALSQRGLFPLPYTSPHTTMTDRQTYSPLLFLASSTILSSTGINCIHTYWFTREQIVSHTNQLNMFCVRRLVHPNKCWKYIYFLSFKCVKSVLQYALYTTMVYNICVTIWSVKGERKNLSSQCSVWVCPCVFQCSSVLNESSISTSPGYCRFKSHPLLKYEGNYTGDEASSAAVAKFTGQVVVR